MGDSCYRKLQNNARKLRGKKFCGKITDVLHKGLKWSFNERIFNEGIHVPVYRQ
jgi:hypothetical protein